MADGDGSTTGAVPNPKTSSGTTSRPDAETVSMGAGGDGADAVTKTCGVSHEQLWSWIDRDSSALDEHVASCPRCRERAEHIRSQIQRVAGGAWARNVRDADKEPVPERIGPYRIVRRHDEGGMGVVYLGVREDGKFKKHVAVKILKRGLDSDDVLRRFELERQLLGVLNHPGIARLYDAGKTDDGRPYFVMEFIDGLDVITYADRHRLGIAERLQLFQEVCAAVHYAHRNLVVHRDLKPNNILVTAEGRPKLLDFGIAKLLNPDLAIVGGDPTAPEMRILTPEYASPEQVRGEPITTASDVYSLGVLLYELLSGHRPYRLKSRVRAEIERVICEEDPERPSTAISKIEEVREQDRKTGQPTTRSITPEQVCRSRESRPERLRRILEGDIDNIVLMAMKKEPQRRYESAEQLAADIGRHLKGMPIIARPDTLSYRVSKFVRRNRVGVAAGAAIAVLLVLGTAATAAGWKRAEERRVEAVEATEAARRSAILAEERKAQAEESEQEARSQREIAERRLGSGLKLANVFIYDLGEDLAKIEGALPARDVLVGAAVEYLEQLEEETREDPDVQPILADGYREVGDIIGGKRNPNLGDPAAALPYYEHELALRQALRTARPDDAELRYDIAVTRMRMADAHGRSGDTKTALRIFEEALAETEALVAADDQWRHRRLRAIMLVAAGDMHIESGDRATGMTYYEKSAAIRRELAQVAYDDPKDADSAQRGLAVILGRIGGEWLRAGNPDGARERFEQALAIREKLLAADPENAQKRRDIVVAHILVAQAYRALNKPDEALQHLRAAVPVADARMDDNPRDARAQYDRADLDLELAQAHFLANAPADAGDAARAGVDRITTWVEAHPNDTRARSLQADALLTLAEAEARTGDLPAAVRHADRALEVNRQLRSDETNADVDIQQAAILSALGGWLVDSGSAVEGCRHLRAARDLYASLRIKQPSNVDIGAGEERTRAAIERAGGCP